ncbi:MAG: type VI secretion system tip protein VgrG [Planctomycetales bacterium]|nr:type VI secretion system tip protein VgrG [Planctomycetales bacterium]
MSQAQRIISIEGLGQDLRLVSFAGREEISRLFSYNLQMVSPKETIDAKEIIGKKAHIRIDLAPSGERYISGIISRFSADFADEGGTTYRAELVPSLWLLSQTSDCRIFQEMTVPQIVEKIFKDNGLTKYELNALRDEYPKLEYCVQFRETDFNFVSRLMEQYGIFYYFKHAQGEDTLVLGDSADAFVDMIENKVNFPPTRSRTKFHKDHVYDWRHDYEFVSGKWAQTEYDFKKPSNNLLTEERTVIPLAPIKPYEIYDYPGEYVESKDGRSLTKKRMEEEEVAFDRASGASTCRSFQVGGKFEFEDYVPPGEKGKKFVVLSVSHRAQVAGAYSAGASYSTGAEYSNTFTCIQDSVSFRPARITPKPVAAIQSAVVIGPKGEEIYCDKYGRVKVQFHWDREVENKKTQSNSLAKRALENSSCWMRTSHSVAGKKWGFVAIPRIGQEVVVDFLDGDPDRPLIVGSVYNEEQPPHYTLPDEKTKTYIKTNTSKGGEGHNELMFEDKKDDERLYMHAQKNMDVRVLNDSKERIFGHRHQIIGWEKDGAKGGDQREMVYQDKHLNIKRDQQEHVEGNMRMMIGNGEAADGGKLELVIEKDKLQSIGGSNHLTVTNDHNEKVGRHYSATVGGDWQTKATLNMAQEALNIHVKAGMTLVLDAGMVLSLKAGGSFISIGPDGVTIQGTMVKINSGGAAVDGNGCSPTEPGQPAKAAPIKPDLAHSSESGMKSCD